MADGMLKVRSVIVPNFVTIGQTTVHSSLLIFSEREVRNAIWYCPSVCMLSVTFVHPTHSTQTVDIFGNVSSPFGTLVNR